MKAHISFKLNSTIKTNNEISKLNKIYSSDANKKIFLPPNL